MSDPKTRDQDDAAVSETDFTLIFAPSWARQAPDAARHAGGRQEAEEPRERPRFDRERRDRGPRPGGDRDRRPPRDRDGRPPRSGAHRPGPAREAEYRPLREELPSLPLDIRILPEQKALAAIVRRIQTSHRAYPLRDLARLFLDNPASCLVRIENAKNAASPVPLFQCRVCGMPGVSDEEISNHLVTAHLGDFFDVEEVDGEPPSGVFNCVARCGLSGELLGPPNHHSFNARVQELLRTRFSNMREEEYRNRIEMVRDPEVVEQWRQASRRRKLYRRKLPDAAATAPAGDAATEGAAPATAAPAAEKGVERQAAELIFLREILPGQVGSARHLVCPAETTRQIPNRSLSQAIRETVSREERFPASLFFALRGAFRHRGLHLFRVGDAKGADFVMARQPTPLDATHAVAEVRQALAYLAEHPACTRQELIAALTAADDTAAQQHLSTQLNWLVEKAHIIEYFNGVLCMPTEYPKFRPLPHDGRPAPRPRPSPPPRPSAQPAAEQAPPETPTRPAVPETPA